MEKHNEVVEDFIFNFLSKAVIEFGEKYKEEGYLAVIGTIPRIEKSEDIHTSIIVGHRNPSDLTNYTRLIKFKTTKEDY